MYAQGGLILRGGFIYAQGGLILRRGFIFRGGIIKGKDLHYKYKLTLLVTTVLHTLRLSGSSVLPA